MSTIYLGGAFTLLVTCFSGLAAAEQLRAPQPIGEPATKLYRQVLPDGRLIYSDKPVKGAKIDDTITPDPATSGRSWKSESGKFPVAAPRADRTPVSKVPSIPPFDQPRTLDNANADMIKAEMLLEDAKKRQAAGVEPLPGERTANVGGGSRLNEAYQARQKSLARDVDEAEAMLKNSRAEWDALRKTR